MDDGWRIGTGRALRVDKEGTVHSPYSGAGGGGSEGWALFSGNKVQNLEAGAPTQCAH
jgi:hypothetical protein